MNRVSLSVIVFVTFVSVIGSAATAYGAANPDQGSRSFELRVIFRAMSSEDERTIEAVRHLKATGFLTEIFAVAREVVSMESQDAHDPHAQRKTVFDAISAWCRQHYSEYVTWELIKVSPKLSQPDIWVGKVRVRARQFMVSGNQQPRTNWDYVNYDTRTGAIWK